MNVIDSLVIAISMYSKIPMPGVDWNKENMRYAMCFFPVVGGIIGLVMYLAGRIAVGLSFGPLMRGAVFTLIPILISGGIHMDGFMDTCDALASWGDREKKLQILKDSHAGAFAVLGVGCFLIWNAAVWSEMPEDAYASCCLIYVISRALSGFSVVTFPPARQEGLLRTFRDGAERRIVRVTMLVILAATLCAALTLRLRYGFGILAGGAAAFVYYGCICRRYFGGTTGDVAGYFLEISELAMLTGVWIAALL